MSLKTLNSTSCDDVGLKLKKTDAAIIQKKIWPGDMIGSRRSASRSTGLNSTKSRNIKQDTGRGRGGAGRGWAGTYTRYTSAASLSLSLSSLSTSLSVYPLVGRAEAPQLSCFTLKLLFHPHPSVPVLSLFLFFETNTF